MSTEKLTTNKNAKQEILSSLEKRVNDKILEKNNFDLLKKLIENADTLDEAIKIAELGTTYKRTGFHFDKRLERQSNDISYFKKNNKLSFKTGSKALSHKLIIGDNYPALLNLLIEYKNKIDVIYIDPPYGKDSMGEFADTNYDNAITRDNLLSMLYPRLQVAKQLLSDTGVIFCSIDDRNQAYVKCLFDEVFEERNFVANCFVLDNLKGKTNDNFITSIGHYILCYAKNKSAIKEFNEIENMFGDKVENKYNKEDDIGFYGLMTFTKTGQGKTREERPYMFYPVLVRDNKLFSIKVEEYKKIYNKETKSFDDDFIAKLKSKYEEEGYSFILPVDKNGYYLRWTCGFETFSKKINTDIIYDNGVYQKNRPAAVELLQEYMSGTPKNLFYAPTFANGTNDLEQILPKSNFEFPKPIALIEHILKIYGSKNAIVLDFFAGSGTTGQAVLELNRQDGGSRQFILCTSNEITETTPNGIAQDVTSKRLKRVMTGKCYDDTDNFEWIKKNKPLGDNLDVYEISTVSNFESAKGETPFDVIDETLYGNEKFKTVKEKVEWVCDNFEITQKRLEKK
jgi:adenine-specific DNA-methyltransferase